jgi:NADH-quinone oxidoreductase subunit L
MADTVIWIPLLPFFGFLVNGLFGRRLEKRLCALFACAGPIASGVISVAAFRHVLENGPIEANLYTWVSTGALRIPFTLVFDRLSAVMCLVVTGVGSLIHVYSTEYMEHESRGGYARYFAFLNLFTAMMLLLVLGGSLPLLFVGWEGVGLCSYLLIGFWYGEIKNADAGKKAFIVNRVGDFGFLLGMFLLFAGIETLDIDALCRFAENGVIPRATCAAAALLLFFGACGKSAQIPLYVWLPDAMAGPTPVSALIHAATMVTAGVYMVARMHPLFLAGGGALAVVAAIGIATAFFSATMAIAENDLKKVLAYSTISQLGYMFVGAGAAAFAASIFHLVTHAFFKALLFLGAGAVMHGLDGIVDLRKMGGLSRKMPLTALLFTIGALGLSGIPPFAGFFSKDEILSAVFARWSAGEGAGWLAVWVLGVLTAAITAFYTFRAVGLAFFGEPRGPADSHLHARDPGLRMLVPLGVLAAATVGGGFLNVPPVLHEGWEFFAGFLGPVLPPAAAIAHEVEAGTAAVEWLVLVIPTALAAVSAAAAFLIYARRPEVARAIAERPLFRPLRRALEEKYGVDRAYERAFVEPLKTGAAALWEWVDVAVIDGTVNGVGRAASRVSAAFRQLQGGFLNQYAFYFAGGAIAVLFFLIAWARA